MNKLQTQINLINDELERLDPDNSIRNLLNNPPSSSTQQEEQRFNSGRLYDGGLVRELSSPRHQLTNPLHSFVLSLSFSKWQPLETPLTT